MGGVGVVGFILGVFLLSLSSSWAKPGVHQGTNELENNEGGVDSLEVMPMRFIHGVEMDNLRYLALQEINRGRDGTEHSRSKRFLFSQRYWEERMKRRQERLRLRNERRKLRWENIRRRQEATLQGITRRNELTRMRIQGINNFNQGLLPAGTKVHPFTKLMTNSNNNADKVTTIKPTSSGVTDTTSTTTATAVTSTAADANTGPTSNGVGVKLSDVEKPKGFQQIPLP